MKITTRLDTIQARKKAWVEIICERNSGVIIGASAICEENAVYYIVTAAAAMKGAQLRNGRHSG